MLRGRAPWALGCMAALCSALATGASLMRSPPESPPRTPPEPPFEAMTWPATLARPPAQSVVLGSHRVLFEDTSLETLRGWVGVGGVSRLADVPDSVAWLCYTVKNAPAPYRVWFISDDTGPGEHSSSGMIAQATQDVRAAADCPRLPASAQPVALDVPVWIGSPAAEVQRLLGAPSYTDGEWQSYDFERKVVGNGRCEGGYDLSNNLSVKILEGVISEINVSQATDC